MSDTWTNESVLAFAGDLDPVEAATHRARQVAFEQATLGWSGPPFDPFELARRLGISIRPADGLDDARTVAEAGKLVIEFNPRRPRGRLRYSIAHEIAHTFFDDVASVVRHRTAQGAIAGPDDNWQLEMLCNIAASELLLPSFSMQFEDLDSSPISIDQLMELRTKFDVSIEAIVRRFVAGTAHHVACLATSRVNDHVDEPAQYRVDYVTTSRTWSSPPVRRGDVLDWTALRACTAVGFTWQSAENAGEPVEVHAVGAPPYPGRRFPRVIALVQQPGEVAEPSTHIRYVAGDASAPSGDGHRVIVHVTNNSAHALGQSGFARCLQQRFSSLASNYRSWTISSNNLRLGNVHTVEVETGITVASVVAQEGFGSSAEPRVRYEPLRAGLTEVAIQAQQRDASVHMPRIGTGQAGGRWEMIEPIVDEVLCRNRIDVTVYDQPGRSHR
jgi:O-acetyl-ADP-ribose deacetylase (regulator of RNase III)